MIHLMQGIKGECPQTYLDFGIYETILHTARDFRRLAKPCCKLQETFAD